MPALFLQNMLTQLRLLATQGDTRAVGIMAITNGTRYVDTSVAVEASDVRKVTCQIRDQDGSAVKAVTHAVIESFADAGTSLTAVRLATAAALAACTPAGTGVGHTLTANGNGALTVDGVAVANGNRILVKDQVAQDDNGIYVVTDLGSVGTPFILTRATDFDTAAEAKKGLQIPVTLGTANTGKTFVHTTSGTIVMDTTSLTFADLTSFTVADLRGMVAGGTGTLKKGSATSRVWMQSDSNGVFSIDLKNVLIGSVMLKLVTDNGETEMITVAFA